MNETTLTRMFDELATRGPWTGADSTASVRLPDGRTLWLFSDTMLGRINPDHTRDRNTPMVHNTLVTQTGTTLTPVIGGTPTAPDAIIRPPAPDFAWIGGAITTRSAVNVLANTYRMSGTGQLDFTLTGTLLAELRLPDLKPTRTLPLSLGARIAWGAAFVEDNLHTYVFGSEYIAATKQRYAVLARAPRGRLDQQWRFWTGSTWSTDPNNTARLAAGVGTAFGVQPVRGGFVLVTLDCREPFMAGIVAYSAPALTGPWSGPTPLLTTPEPATRDVIVYDARVHPHLADPGRMLITYNVHSLNPDVLYSDARVYRPRFVSVPLP